MGMDYSRAKDWIVAERGFEPEHLGKCESIMCQGNGYLCLRNATDEFNPREQRDLFVAGTFNKFDDNEVTELPNAADVSRLEIKLDGQRFSLLTGTVEDYDRTLDLKTGETVRKVVWKAPNGRRYELCFRRFVSMERLHVIGQKLCVRPLDGEALLAAAKETGCIVTTEEHSIMGGLGSAVAGFIGEHCPVPVVRHGVNDEFGRSGKAELVLSHYGLTAEGIADKVRSAIALKK